MTIHSADRYESALAAAMANGTPPDERLIARIQSNAHAMEGAYLPDDLMRRTATAYADSVDRMVETPQGFASPQHRSHLRNLVISSLDMCGAQPGHSILSSSGSTHALTGHTAELRSFNWRVGVPVAALFIAKLCFLAYILMVIARKREERRVRHHCHVDIEITTNGARIPTKMIDVSATGAKIKIPSNLQLPPRSMLQLEGRNYLIKVAWQNAHFAGIMFKHPLTPRHIKRLSTGVQRRPSTDTSDVRSRRSA